MFSDRFFHSNKILLLFWSADLEGRPYVPLIVPSAFVLKGACDGESCSLNEQQIFSRPLCEKRKKHSASESLTCPRRIKSVRERKIERERERGRLKLTDMQDGWNYLPAGWSKSNYILT